MMCTRHFFALCLVVGMTGCITTNQSSSMMDPYDPRNNIPLLQAATRTSGVGVTSSPVTKSAAEQAGGKGSELFFVNGNASNTNAQKLRELKALKDEGILTQREYDTKKAELLKGF